VQAAVARPADGVLGMSMSAQTLRGDVAAHRSTANSKAKGVGSMNEKSTRR
jgi:hypothetical protein